MRQTAEDHAAVEAATFTDNYAGYRPDPKYVESTERLLRSEVVPRAKPPARLLDVGCGAGDLMSVAQELGYEVTGIDISKTSAAICRQRHLDARAADFLACDFPRRFDVITMWDVVAHLSDPAAFVSRARALLAPQGILLIKTPVSGDLSVSLSNRWPRLAGVILGAPSHCQYFDRESLSVLLSRARFDFEWIHARGARSSATGGSLKRRAARVLRIAIKRLSGDYNLCVIASPLP